MAEIQRRLKSRPPKILVMYGDRNQQYWHEIDAFVKALPERQRPRIASLTHPVYPGMTSQYWIDCGKKLKRSLNTSECDPTF